MMTKKSNFIEREEKRDVKINGKCKTFKIRPSIWKQFVKLAKAANLTNEQAAKDAQRECNGTLKEAIEKWVLRQVETIYSFENREAWLEALVEAMKPEFAVRGCPITRPIKVSIGFTSKGARSKAIGECWNSEASGDGANQIFISPYIEDVVKLAGILTHEMIHAWDDCKNAHKAPFKRGQKAMGLEGKATECVDGAQWREWALPLIEGVGPMPHASLTRLPTKKKQTTRMLKVQCPCCEFTFRAAKTSLEAACVDGKLVCPSPACATDIELAFD
jgi:hypothetical protein